MTRWQVEPPEGIEAPGQYTVIESPSGAKYDGTRYGNRDDARRVADHLNREVMKSALDMAMTVHGHQVDKAGRPYMGHVLRVAGTVAPPAGLGKIDEVLWCVALLHDVLEDCPAAIREDYRKMIRRECGQRVHDAVIALTRAEGEPYLEDYIPRVAGNVYATQVKIADLRHNLDASRLPEPPNPARIEKYEQALAYLLRTSSGSL